MLTSLASRLVARSIAAQPNKALRIVPSIRIGVDSAMSILVLVNPPFIVRFWATFMVIAETFLVQSDIGFFLALLTGRVAQLIQLPSLPCWQASSSVVNSPCGDRSGVIAIAFAFAVALAILKSL